MRININTWKYRWRKRFALWPKRIGDVYIWLERYSWRRIDYEKVRHLLPEYLVIIRSSVLLYKFLDDDKEIYYVYYYSSIRRHQWIKLRQCPDPGAKEE